MQNLREHIKDGVLRACYKVCGKKSWSRSKGDTWWWNEEVKEAVTRKKKHSTEENKRRYKSMKNKANKQFQKQ